MAQSLRLCFRLKPLGFVGLLFFSWVFFLSSLAAQDGHLGGQVLIQHGEKAVVLFPASGGMDILPRQHLWREEGKEWTSYKGWLSSTFQTPGNLSLIYRRTVFKVNEDLSLKFVRKAPQGLYFLATSATGEQAPTLVRRGDGEFGALTSSGNIRSFPFLSPYKERTVIPWSSPRMPFLYFPRQKGQEEPKLCAFIPSLERGRLFEEGLQGFSLGGISEGPEGIWLQGHDGTHLYFDGTQLEKTPLPGGLSTQDLISFDWDGEGWSGLYGAKEGPLQLARTGANTIVLPAFGEGAQVQINGGPAAHMQSMMMFLVMVVALFMVLRWRQESEAQLPGEIEELPASLWLRSFAFIMDFFLLFVPVMFFSSLMGVDQSPDMDLYRFAEMSTEQQTRFFGEFNELKLVFGVLMVLLSIPYHVALERWLGGSFGKLFFRIKVVDAEGKAPGMKASLIKALWRSLDIIIFPLISFISAITHEKRMSLGDRFSGLRVIQIRRN